MVTSRANPIYDHQASNIREIWSRVYVVGHRIEIMHLMFLINWWKSPHGDTICRRPLPAAMENDNIVLWILGK